MRVYGILADYPDQNDHDVLRSDPIFKLLCDRSTTDNDLASQPTLSRFENATEVSSFWRLRDVFIDQFIASFPTPPRRLTLDMDPFDDPTHGGQQLTFFHGCYDQYQYLPRIITCAENELTVGVCLLHGTAHAALGADDDLEYLVRRLREAWPGVRIHFRGDSGLGVPRMYDACERFDVDYTLGMGMNARLKKLTDPLLAEAVARREGSGEPQRLFTAFWYRADSWPAQRWVVVKCEANAEGTNRRAWSPTAPGQRCCRRRPTTATPTAAKAKTATRNSKTACKPIASATIATSPTCFAFTCMPPPTTCWSTCAGRSPTRLRRRLPRKSPWKPSPTMSAAAGTITAASAIRWAKGNLSPGGRV